MQIHEVNEIKHSTYHLIISQKHTRVFLLFFAILSKSFIYINKNIFKKCKTLTVPLLKALKTDF